MSTFTVTAEQLTIHPHPNADALELAAVGLYRAVVAKGQFHTGDFAVYIPEQAILPDPLIDELGLTGRLAGKAHNRVKAVRLRGELSQGIVCRPGAVAGVDLAAAASERTDFAELLGVSKWVPEVPVHMSGQVQSAGDLMAWVDIENLKRYPDVFAAGEPVTATEKVHGTCCLFTLRTADGATFVSSKGFGSRGQSIVASDTNVYWRAVRSHNVEVFAREVATKYSASRVGVFGEVYGNGIQDLGYAVNVRQGGPAYVVFDVSVEVDGQVRYLDQDEVVELLAVSDTGLRMVPRLYDGPFDVAALTELAQGREQMSGTEAHVREGVVIRPKRERYSPVLGGRAIAKLVGDGYLLRKGGTEYE